MTSTGYYLCDPKKGMRISNVVRFMLVIHDGHTQILSMNIPPKRFQDEIDATHPMNDFPPEREAAIFAADRMAMELVGERHEKRELVHLVRWLILRNPEGII